MDETDMNSFLEPSSFSSGLHPFPNFKIEAENFTIGGTELKNVALAAHYDDDMQLVLEYVVKTDLPMNITKLGIIRISGDKFPEPVDLFAVNRTWSSDKANKLTLVAQREPLLVKINSSATVAEGVIMNGPEILWSEMKLEFRRGDYLISLVEFPSVAKLRKQKRLFKRGRIATGIVTIRRVDGDRIDPKTVLLEFSHLDRFLTFVKGAHCGIGNIIGTEPGGTVAFAHLGFLRMDQFQVSTGWCDMAVIKSVPKIYQLYSKAVSVKLDEAPILRAIEFYRASNVARESSTEMALVASHAALETIIPHLLKTRAGWSSNLFSKQVSFHDKLRAAASFVGLNNNPFDHLNALQARSKADSNVDAFELLSVFRNRIIHQGKPFKYSGVELMEAWTMSQWLCEVFLFFLLAYRGDMNDRRQYQGWRGEMIKPIPLPNIK